MTEDEHVPPAADWRATRMKVHLRRVPIRGTTYHVITLRPGTEVKFSTNFYHGTWHVVSDVFGSWMLARLMWGLAFQTHPNTLVLIAPPHLQPSPFDGARSRPAVLAARETCPLRDDDMRELKARLGRLPNTQTIQWDFRGLAGHTSTPEWERSRKSPWQKGKHMYGMEDDAATFLCGGMICYHAARVTMKDQAAVVRRMSPSTVEELARRRDIEFDDYYFMTWDGRSASGEVQIFCDYRDRLKAAVAARKRVLNELTEPVSADELEDRVSAVRREILPHIHRPGRSTEGGSDRT